MWNEYQYQVEMCVYELVALKPVSAVRRAKAFRLKTEDIEAYLKKYWPLPQAVACMDDWRKAQA